MGFAFFDPNIRKEEKLLMVRNVKRKKDDRNSAKRVTATEDLSDKHISDFVTTNTTNFFEIRDLEICRLSSKRFENAMLFYSTIRMSSVFK